MWTFFQEENAQVFAVPARIGWLYRQARKRYGSAYIHVLNIGIGAGTLELMCKDTWRVNSIDLVPETVERMRNKGIDARVGSINALPYPDASMDVVFCSEVLEHLEDDVREKGLREMYRVLRPGGVLIGSVPINEDLNAQRTACPSCGHAFHHCGHLKSYTVASIREELTRHGFRVRKTYKSAFPDFSRQSWLGKILMVPFWMLGRVGRGFFQVICGLVGKK
jgi:SAM-dependent methyltransferase